MLAKDLIDRIERLGLLDPEVIETLRQQLQEIRARVTPEALAKLLVDNGQLTRFQATKLIGELRSGDYSDDEAAAQAVVEVESLDNLAIIDGDDVVEAVMIVDEDAIGQTEAILLDDDGEILDADLVDADIIDADVVEAEVYDDGVIEEAIPVDGESRRRGSGSSRPQRRAVPKKVPEKSQWDSFKIYGYSTILAILCVSFFVLYWWFSRGNEEETLKHVDGLWNSQNYSGAMTAYGNYLASFSGGREVSRAKVRIVLCKLYLEKSNNLSNATKPHLLAAAVLPTIEQESALNDERGNVAGFLMDIADLLVKQADEEADTKKKDDLLGVLSDHQTLMENPNFVPTSIKQNLQPRLEALAENRARVRRDIDRVNALTKSLADIRQALDKKDTVEAYRVRSELVRTYPQLARDQPELAQLVLEASGIQQQLVKHNLDAPVVSTEPIKTNVSRSIDLANRRGRKISELTGQVYYGRTRGSIVALAADDGRVLWRQFVGFRDQHAPISLGQTPAEGVLLSDGERLEIQKLDGNNGSIVWRVPIGEDFFQPVVFSGTIYVSTKSGRVVSLDAQTGIARWVSQIPQPLGGSPRVDTGKGVVYIMGNHSNLYLLSNSDGKSLESFYVGHEPGTVITSPVPLLGHLFIVENAAADFSLVHIYRVDEKGVSVKPAQNDFRLIGNVQTQPEVAGRRLNVLTDRGQVSVLDVETTAEKEQVSVAAELPASYDAPVKASMGVERGQMWVAGSRLVRYELQINTAKVVRDWVLYNGDLFNAPPRPLGSAIIVSRVVSGTQGLRISALDPKKGDEIWRTDIGVPTSLVAAGANGAPLYAVSGQAALYVLDSEALQSGSTVAPAENPGISGRAMMFGDPIDMSQGRFVLHNSETPGQLLVFDPSRDREKLRLVATILSGGTPTVAPIRIGDGVLFCLNNGRITLMNWQTGAPLASPFQAPTKPGEEYVWTNPVPLQGGKQFVICDSYKKLRRISAEGQLKMVEEVTLERDILGGAAVVGGTVLLAVKGPGSDLLVAVDSKSLQPKGETSIGGKILVGPFSVEGWQDAALMILDGQRLRAVGDDGKMKWEVVLPDDSIAGAPLLVSEDKLIVCGDRGWVISIDPRDGKQTSSSDLSQPISTTPMLFKGGLLVPGAEGAVFAVSMPQGT